MKNNTQFLVEVEVTPSTNPVCSQQYNLDIGEKNQALLVSHAKKRAPAGAPPPGPALLVPELCYLTGLCWHLSEGLCTISAVTRLVPAGKLNGKILSFPGLTDKMRNDFVIMKALHDHTKLNPEQREGRLSGFVSKIQK